MPSTTPGRHVPPPQWQPVYRTSRWAKTQTTFGPVGRIVATLLMLLPIPILVAAVFTGIGIVGAGIYALVLLPWGLRHVWAKARIPI